MCMTPAVFCVYPQQENEMLQRSLAAARTASKESAQGASKLAAQEQARLQKRVDSLSEQLRASKEKADDAKTLLRRQIKSLKSEAQHAADEAKVAHQLALAAANEKTASAEEQLEELQAQLAAAEARATKQAAEVATLREAVSGAEASASAQAAQHEQTLAALKASHSKERRQLRRDHKKELQARSDEHEKVLDEVQVDAAGHEAKVRSQLSAATRECETLEKARATLESKYSKCRAALKAEKSNVQSLKQTVRSALFAFSCLYVRAPRQSTTLTRCVAWSLAFVRYVIIACVCLCGSLQPAKLTCAPKKKRTRRNWKLPSAVRRSHWQLSSTRRRRWKTRLRCG